MARQTNNGSHIPRGVNGGGRSSKNAYKMGKLSKNARFSTPRKINYKLIFVLLALLLSFVGAMILGNYLGKKAEELQNSNVDTPQDATIPTPDKVSPKVNLNAFYVDFSTALPPTAENSNSLSNQTGEAREKGNAIFIEFIDKNGNFIYSSDKVNELSVPHNENLTLARLKNHLIDYYREYVVGYLKSNFSTNLEASERTEIQATELLLLGEATEKVFSQLVVEFSDNITKNNLIHYQTYLLNLKLACESTPIGVKIPLSFVTNAANHGILAEIMKIADFYVLDLTGKNADEITEALSPFAYFLQEYKAAVIISSDEETLSERIDALKKVGVDNYIVK